MKLRSEEELDKIRGKMLLGAATIKEQKDFLMYVVAIERLLESADKDDYFSTEGWRNQIGLPYK